MPPRTPAGPPPPPVAARLRIRYAKRGRLRFASHRDLARLLERALRRAGLPLAYSAGFSPHPRVSYAGAAPTGAASEAEYLEVGLESPVDPGAARDRLNAALPDGLDVVEVVAAGPERGGLGERMAASVWRVELPGVAPAAAGRAVAAFLAAPTVPVIRATRQGRVELDARAAVVSLTVLEGRRAILELVARHTTPAVRPDDVLAGLRASSGLEAGSPPVATRLAQGPLSADGLVGDPLAADRSAGTAVSPEGVGQASGAQAPDITERS